MADDNKTSRPEDTGKVIVTENEESKSKDVRIYKKVQRSGRTGG